MVRSWLLPFYWDVLGLRALPAVTSAIKVLTQTFDVLVAMQVTNESVSQVVDEIVDVVRLFPRERVCPRTWSRLSTSLNHRSLKK